MVVTKLSSDEVIEKAIRHMAMEDYKLVSRSEGRTRALVFEDGKEFKIWLLVLGILFLVIIGGVVYYLMATRHTISITISTTAEGSQVQATTNTQESMLVSTDFLNSL